MHYFLEVEICQEKTIEMKCTKRREDEDEMYQEEKMKKKMLTVPYMLWTIFEL